MAGLSENKNAKLLTVALLQFVVAGGPFLVGPASFFHPTLSWADTSFDPSVNAEELTKEISSHLMETPEFAFIREQANSLGIPHAYLFGGTAAALGHYAKWNVQRQKGDTRFQPDRFDYDYTNIYRSTQDADIVIDGTPEQAHALQTALAAKFPHLQGSKSVWEVRLLKAQIGDKEALLDNPDYLNQHTDSNSTGMIELTESQDPLIRDLRDWNSKEPIFLKDIESSTLHYYYSPLHDTTSRFKEGKNPPIVSVIRYLTKAFQYELKIPPEDEKILRKIIGEFNPKTIQGTYLPGWIEKNGKKLIQNAVNIEYAWNELERLGLRQKLIAIQNNPTVRDSLALWMSKEPLRSSRLGQGKGKTAKELGIDIVAHETNNFLAYESITRAHTGDANVLISRDGHTAESAVLGDGFYTKIGTRGAAGTGLTIRFKVNPNAREGDDFIYKSSHSYVIFKNKNALQVIPESLNIGPVEYFEMLANDQSLDASDRGILEKLKRRLSTRNRVLDETQTQKLSLILEAQLGKRPLPFPFFTEFKNTLPDIFSKVSDKNQNQLLSVLESELRTPDLLNSSFLSEFKNIFPRIFSSIPEGTQTHLYSLLENELKKRPLPIPFLKTFKTFFPEIYDRVPYKTIEALNDDILQRVRSAGNIEDVGDEIQFAQLKPAEMTRALADLALRSKNSNQYHYNRYIGYFEALNPTAQKVALKTALEIQEANPGRPLNVIPLTAKVAPELLDDIMDKNSKQLENAVLSIASEHHDSDPKFRARVVSLLESSDPAKRTTAIYAFRNFNSISDEEKARIFREINSPVESLRNAAIKCIYYQDLVPPPEFQIPILNEYIRAHHETIKPTAQILKRMQWEPETFAAALSNIEKTQNNDLSNSIIAQSKNRPEYIEALVASAEKSPFSWGSISRITQLHCQSEACVKIYLSLLQSPEKFCGGMYSSDQTRSTIILLLQSLTAPLDSRILSGLKNWIFETAATGMTEKTRLGVGLLYFDRGGEDPQTLKTIKKLIQQDYKWSFGLTHGGNPSHLGVLEEIEVKLKSLKPQPHCGLRMLETLLQ
jgi:hypothetical protein